MNIIQFPRVSNRADWIQTFELVDDDTDEVITDLDDVTIRFELRDGCNRLFTVATGDSEVTVSPYGTIEVHFPASRMGSLCRGTYEIGLTVERDGVIEQEFIGSLPVFEGVARA